MKGLDKVNMILEQANKELSGFKTEESTDVKEYTDLFADAVAVALAKMEKAGHEFENARAAERFVRDMFIHLRGPGRSDLKKRLMKFDRQGANLTTRQARRSL